MVRGSKAEFDIFALQKNLWGQRVDYKRHNEREPGSNDIANKNINLTRTKTISF